MVVVAAGSVLGYCAVARIMGKRHRRLMLRTSKATDWKVEATGSIGVCTANGCQRLRQWAALATVGMPLSSCWGHHVSECC